MGRRVQRTVLPGGTRVVTERVPSARSVSLGIWVAVGSRDEPAERAGVSHFLEHLLFKGTETRDSRQIAVAVDALGGEMNAYTSKEHTVFYLRVPTAGAAIGMDLLVDLVAAPALREEDVAGERTVILEELAACGDSPEDRVDELLWRAIFPKHPLGWDVLGTEATVSSMDRDAVVDFFGRWYRPGNLVVAAAGAVDHGAVVEAAARLDGQGRGETPARHAPERPVKAMSVQRRATEQAHLALGWRGPGYRDDDRVALDVVEQVLGGGPSSRLFQEVREQRSLAYTVYASAAEFVDVGALAVYAGVAPERAREALVVMGEIVGDLAAHGVTDEELAVAKGYLEGSMWLSLEDNPSRMSRIGWWEVTESRVPPPEEYLAQLAALTIGDVARVAARVLGGPRVLAAVGPFRAVDLA